MPPDSLAADVDLLSETPDDTNLEDVQNDADLLAKEETEEQEIETLETDEVEQEEEKVEEEPEEPSKFPYSRPAIKDITKEFPEFFKKFPSMKDVIFREKEFTTIFPTVDSAKEAQESATALQDFREDLFSGTGEKFTSALKEVGELEKFSKGFLKNLQSSDKDLYWEVVTPTMESIVRSFYKEGIKRGDKNIQLSAENLSIYLFDTAEVAEGKKTTIKENPKVDDTVAKEKRDWEVAKYKDFYSSVQDGCLTGLTDSISLKDSKLSTRMQGLLRKEIITEVDNLIRKDDAHQSFINSLWTKTKQAGYTSEIKSSIISAYLERAKSLVPSIRRRLLAEALGSSPEEAGRKKEIIERVQSRKEPGGNGRPSNGNGVKVTNPKSVDWNKTSDMDFLNDNTTLKGRK